MSDDALLGVARAAAQAAAAVLVDTFGGPLEGLDTKSSRTDLVSDADREAERAAVGVITDRRPDDRVIAEEGSDVRGASGIRWVVDPLDGTINFLWGIPYWAVSVAALDDEGTRVGVVIDPSRGETFEAVRGDGARRDGTTLQVRPPVSLEQSLVGTGFSYRPEQREAQARRLVHVAPRVSNLRRFGAAALDLCQVAAGRLDGFFETGLQPWDWEAGALIVREAGGQTAVDDITDPHLCIAASDGLFSDLRALLHEASR